MTGSPQFDQAEMPTVVAVLGVGSSLEEINIDFDMIYRFWSGSAPSKGSQKEITFKHRDNSEPLLSCRRAVSTFCSVV